MALCHRGMRISESDWTVFLGHAAATLAKFQVPPAEQGEVVALVELGLTRRTKSGSVGHDSQAHRGRCRNGNVLSTGTATLPAEAAREENPMSNETKTLYARLGGYDAITAVANDLLPRLQADPQLGRF